MIVVECAGVSVIRSGASLLGGVSFNLETAGFVGVLGPNGAGKSTLLRVLAGLQAPERGEVRWNGQAATRWPARRRATFCGYLPQQFAPAWDYSASDIIALGVGRGGHMPNAPTGEPGARRNIGGLRVGGLLAEFGLDELGPRRWSGLSGGERARVMLAATLAPGPALVLADEPGASLDVRHRLDLLHRLQKAARNALVVAVMHDLDLALRFCDRILLLDDGALAADSDPAALLASGMLDKVFGLRLQKERRRDDHDWVLGLG